MLQYNKKCNFSQFSGRSYWWCKGCSFFIDYDESTDISVTRYLCVCIKYYSKDCSADGISEKLLAFLTELNLDMKMLIGLDTDGANSLCGKHHSVYTALMSTTDKLQLVPCICHSLNNAASKVRSYCIM
jgi:hypothetical protein